MTDQSKPATVMPVIGSDGKLLGVTLNGVTCVRRKNDDLAEFAESILWRIVSLPRDTKSKVAKNLIKSDRARIKKLSIPLP